MADMAAPGPVEWLASREGEMLALLAELVNIDSGSDDKAGIAAVAARIEAWLGAHGVPVRRAGGADAPILAANGGGGAGAPALLLGHMDTVFPRGTAAARPFRTADGRAYGPGVADMKSGLVMNAFVLAAFAECGLACPPVEALFTCDEEIASPRSRPHIEAAARRASVVLNAEPGRPNGAVVAERKGALFLAAGFTGRAAHSGANFADGASAITEMARKIVALAALSDPPAGVTVNVGRVAGGVSINTVAPAARAEIDVRFRTAEQREAILGAVRDALAHDPAPDTAAAVEILGEFAPMTRPPGADALLSAYRRAARSVGIEVEAEASGGCSDAGFATALGVPALCGLGPVGGRAHTPDEYTEVASLVPRAQAVAATVLLVGAKPPPRAAAA